MYSYLAGVTECMYSYLAGVTEWIDELVCDQGIHGNPLSVLE